MKINPFIVNSNVLIVIALAFFCSLNLQASVLDTKITVAFTNTTLLDALNGIEKQANITFSFKSSDIAQKKRISLKATNISIARALEQLLAGQNVKFRAIGTQIILYKVQVQAVTANIEPQPQKNTIVDSVRVTVMDTTRVFDTIRVTRYDSVQVKIFDTIRTTSIIDFNTKTCKPSYYSIELKYNYLQGKNFSVAQTDRNTRVETVPFSQAVQCLLGVTKNRISIQTGLGYATENKEFEYPETTQILTTFKVPRLENYTAYDSIYFYMKPLDTIWTINAVTRQRTVYYDSSRIDSSFSRLKTKQIMQSVQIPILVTFNAIEKSHWNVFVRSGLVFSFVRFKQSVFRSATNEPITALNNIVLAPIGCSVYTSIGASFDVYQGLHLGLAPCFSYQISDNYISSNILETSNLRYGFEVSLKKNIK